MSEADVTQSVQLAPHPQGCPTWRGQETLFGLKWMPPIPSIPQSQMPPLKKLRPSTNHGTAEIQPEHENSKDPVDKSDSIVATPAPQTPIKLTKPKSMARPIKSVAFNEHAYVVWWHPACEDGFDYRGVHSGGTHAWDFIQSWLPKGQYEGSKVRLRRFPDTDAAIQGYHEESRQHRAPSMPRLWKHWN